MANELQRDRCLAQIFRAAGRLLAVVAAWLLLAWLIYGLARLFF